MRRFLGVVVAFALGTACSGPQIAAFGSNSEIFIITSPRAAGEGEILKSILEREIVTVQYEKAFEVRLVTTGDVDSDRNRKNIVLLDFLEPKEDLSGTILSLAKGEGQALRAGERNLKTIEDRWAKGQTVVLITAPTKEGLNRLLADEADRLFGYVSDQVQARLNRSLFYAGEQEAATQRLADTYGWSLRLPTNYDIDETYAAQRVIKILRDKPARMITVYWEGGAWEDRAASCFERKKMLAYEYWDQDEVVEDALQVNAGTFLGHDCTVLSGTWENKKYTIGGVFVTYCFRCEDCGQKYVVDAAVFAPGLEKLPLIRELKAVLASFKCCEE